VFKNQQFVPVAGEWKLKSLDIHNPAMNYTVNYNSDALLKYNPFTDITITIDWGGEDTPPIPPPKPPDVIEITEKTDLHPGYSINTNLPKTKMSNTDAIAVVIGNSIYKYTVPVDFAINDATLMRTYLINVLGFKPGNILFRLNTTKGELEDLFGTKGYHKGRL